MFCTPSSLREALSAFIPCGRKTVRLVTGRTKDCEMSIFDAFGTVVNEIKPYALSLGGIANPLSVLVKGWLSCNASYPWLVVPSGVLMNGISAPFFISSRIVLSLGLWKEYTPKYWTALLPL